MGNFFQFFIYPLRRNKAGSYQGNMIGGDMERLGELVEEPCCIYCCVMENG